MVTINIDRKAMIFFGVVVLVFVVAGLAIAFGGDNPAVMGHSAGEIEYSPHTFMYEVEVNVLDNYVMDATCAGFPGTGVYFDSACHRYCTNACNSVGASGGCDGQQDSGLSYISGFNVELDCTPGVEKAACACVN